MEPELYLQVKFKVKQLFDINLDHYKGEQMRRRLDSWLVRSGMPDWSTYFKRVGSDACELARFRDYLTINVSAFFRDPDRWRSLRDTILPELLRSPGPLKVWSAGCSIGAEPYSLAMMLAELAPPRRHHILATDFDRSALTKARARGPYTAEEVQNLTPAQRAAYLEPDASNYFVKNSLAKVIEFREHNLLGEPVPAEFDLIVCRNVVIYFTGDTKDKLYKKFHTALRSGGILFVGSTEIISKPQVIGFGGHGISFYQRM